MTLRATLTEAMGLLREIHALVKAMPARGGSQRPRRFVEESTSAPGVKPCLGCAIRERCARSCFTFDEWVRETGCDRARPGVTPDRSARNRSAA